MLADKNLEDETGLDNDDEEQMFGGVFILIWQDWQGRRCMAVDAGVLISHRAKVAGDRE